MNSPITGKPMRLVREPGAKLNFRKEEFEITYHYYLCEESGEQYTTDELDRINLTQVHNKYREIYGIPFPDEIRAIREKYEVSASKMSDILGFGANSYRLYETGEIPSVANGRLILAIKHPEDFIKQVDASSHILSEKERKKYIEQAEELFEEQRKNAWNIMLSRHIFVHENASEFSGYRKPDLIKIGNIISYFSTRIEELYKTKLNKLLFYSDFGYFRQTGFSMTGITYRAIKLGPVPAAYDMLYNKLGEDELVSINQILFENGNYGEALAGLQEFDETLFTTDEIAILDKILKRFGDLRTSDVVELSHQEIAWKENQEERELISYSKYAFELKNI
jgi:putative zinc finger/helix-turn-helix YgiT family protein